MHIRQMAILEGGMVRAIVLLLLLLLLSVLTSACASDRYYIDNVAYQSEGEWLAAIQKGNSSMLAAVRQRSQPAAGVVRILVPTPSSLEEWLNEHRFYPRCVLYVCRSDDERAREREADAIDLRENCLSTSRAVERSGLFRSVSIEDYSGISQLPSADAERWLVAVRPNLENQAAGWSWYLWKPGSQDAKHLPNFDGSIQSREERVNDWIDKLEAIVKEKT